MKDYIVLQDPTFSTKFKVFFGIALLVKLALLTLFSSGYQDDLFIPFVLNYLEFGGNPWEYQDASHEAFPYPPLMLYILSAFLLPTQFLPNSQIIEGILYGLPLLLSDLLITIILIRLYIWYKKEIFIFYFASPIILFSTYMHGQLDILPTAILFLSIFLLTKRHYLYSAIIAGLAISTKFHTIAALPLMAIYLLNQGKFKETAYMVTIPMLMYFGFSFPYLSTGEGYQELVVQNEKQNLIFDSYFTIGAAKVYLPILAAVIIYLRFAAYRKINTDLLYAAIGALFSIFLLLIEPSPAWYVWMVPFFTIFYIRYFDGLQHHVLHISLIGLYLLYYLLFHEYSHSKLLFLHEEVSLSFGVNSFPLGNIIFTALQAVLLTIIYQFYKNGIGSNSTYTMEQSFIIGIGGDSGSGKSTLIGNLRSMFNDQLLELEGDGDHKWERGNSNWQARTHLDPKANLLHRQAEQVARLKNRKTIKRSDYDHITGTFTEADRIKPKDFVVLAGLHPFYLPKMRKVIDLKIFLDLDERLRTSWKITRDINQRGYSKQQILDSLAARQNDSELYIKPQKQFSDIVISLFPAEENKFNEHIYHGQLGLSIAMNAGIPVDGVIQAFQTHGCKIHWDYSQDLKTQYIRFNMEPLNLDINWYANRFIINSSELLDIPKWQPGYAGIIQFLVMFAISDIMQERAHKHV
ncbi:MAG: uridine kinase [Crocinitomicaceae bacterium]|jgi:uridine kinase